MTITITEKEYESIRFCRNQVGINIESGADDKYVKIATEHINNMTNIVAKYQNARLKAKEFQYWRAIVSKQNKSRNLTSRRIDQLTRDLMKRLKEQG